MPKTIKNAFFDKLSYDNMLKAYVRAKKNKSLKREVLLFEVDLETNLSNIVKSLR